MSVQTLRRGELLEAVSRHQRAAVIAFVAIAAVVIAVILAWPGGRPPLAVLITGIVIAIIAPMVVPWVLERRQPHFRSKDDVERLLNLPVLATWSDEGDH